MATEAQAQEQGDTLKLKSAYPMSNFGWNMASGVKPRKGRADLTNDFVTLRAIVLQSKEANKPNAPLISDTMVIEKVVPNDKTAEGLFMTGDNLTGNDIQLYFREAKSMFFLNAPYPLMDRTQMPFRLVPYDRQKHGVIKNWEY